MTQVRSQQAAGPLLLPSSLSHCTAASCCACPPPQIARRVELGEGVREIEGTRKRKTRESMVSSGAPGGIPAAGPTPASGSAEPCPAPRRRRGRGSASGPACPRLAWRWRWRPSGPGTQTCWRPARCWGASEPRYDNVAVRCAALRRRCPLTGGCTAAAPRCRRPLPLAGIHLAAAAPRQHSAPAPPRPSPPQAQRRRRRRRRGALVRAGAGVCELRAGGGAPRGRLCALVRAHRPD